MPEPTRNTICRRCAGEAAPRSVYCGACRAEMKRQERRAVAQANPLPCVECGSLFVRYRSRVITCSDACRLARITHLGGRQVRVPIVCANEDCGVTFVPSKSNAKTCSSKCRDRIKYLRNRADPEWVAARRALDKDKYQADREAILARQAAWRSANPDKSRAASYDWWLRNRYRVPKNNSWRVRNPEKHALKNRVRQGRIRALTPAAISHHLVLERMRYWGNKCWMCSGPFESIDHVKPIALGGANILANLRPACRFCNSSKRARWFGPAKLSVFVRD